MGSGPTFGIRSSRAIGSDHFSTTSTPRGERTDDLPSKVRQIWLITPVNPRKDSVPEREAGGFGSPKEKVAGEHEDSVVSMPTTRAWEEPGTDLLAMQDQEAQNRISRHRQVQLPGIEGRHGRHFGTGVDRNGILFSRAPPLVLMRSSMRIGPEDLCRPSSARSVRCLERDFETAHGTARPQG